MGSTVYGDGILDGSGSAISMENNGTTLAIGEPYSVSTNGHVGRVRVLKYTLFELRWVQYGNDIFEFEPSDIDDFGKEISLAGDGNTIAIGTPSTGQGGEVRVLRLQVNEQGDGMWRDLVEPLKGRNDTKLGAPMTLSGDGSVLAVAESNGPNVVTYDLKESI